MCIPYIIPDPPPTKRNRKSGRIVHSSSPNSPKLQPAFIEISPRLTYVASPKPDRSPIPPRGRPSAMKPPRAPETEFLDGFVAGEQASRQEEGRAGMDEQKPAGSKPKPTTTPPPQRPAEPSKNAPPATEKPPTTEQPKDLPASTAKPKPSPPPPAPRDPSTIPFVPPPPQPQPQPYQPIRSPYSYTRRPPTHQHASRTRSLSPDSSISRRSFDRLKRNLRFLLERVKMLEAEKEIREVDRRGGRRGWELGMGFGRREGSLIRERRDKERERQRGREEEERWDWEGGGLGRR